jgi:diguanylate cyclase (GGDEF)-like protein
MTIRFGIRVRLFLAAALPAILAISVLLQGFLTRHERILTETLNEHAQGMARQAANAAEFALFTGSQSALQRLADGARASDQHAAVVSFWTPAGELLAVSGQLSYGQSLPVLEPGRPQLVKGRLLTRVPIWSTEWTEPDLFSLATTPTAFAMEGRQLLGHVLVEIELDILQRQRGELLAWALVATGSGLLFAGLLSTLIAASVTQPLGRISVVVSLLSRGVLGARVDTRKAGVLRPLSEGINTMAAGLASNEAMLRERVAQATEELRQQKEQAEHKARTDPLTGVPNRRAFTELARVEIERAQRFGQPLALIAIDLDHFKSINDGHGHAVGDAVLVDFATLVQAQLRVIDQLARIGGEEFVLLLPGTDAKGAQQVAERIRRLLEQRVMPIPGGSLRYTSSFGIAELELQHPGLDRWLARADAALYAAKGNGRNRVELAPDA